MDMQTDILNPTKNLFWTLLSFPIRGLHIAVLNMLLLFSTYSSRCLYASSVWVLGKIFLHLTLSLCMFPIHSACQFGASLRDWWQTMNCYRCATVFWQDLFDHKFWCQPMGRSVSIDVSVCVAAGWSKECLGKGRKDGAALTRPSGLWHGPFHGTRKLGWTRCQAIEISTWWQESGNMC